MKKLTGALVLGYVAFIIAAALVFVPLHQQMRIAENALDTAAAEAVLEQETLTHNMELIGTMGQLLVQRNYEIETGFPQAIQAADGVLQRYNGMLHIVSAQGDYLTEGFTHKRDELTPEQQELYNLLRVSIMQNVIKIDVSAFEFDMETIKVVYWGLLEDDPSLFWLNGRFVGYYMKSSTEPALDAEQEESYTGPILLVELKSLYPEEEIPQRREEFLQQARPVVEQALELDSDLARIHFVHNYIANTVEYVEGEYHSSYSAIVEGKAVCAGYAKAFAYYMDQLGIPNAYCTGYAREEYHAWNLVMVDGEYYNVDVTWDDPSGYKPTPWRYDYFMVSDTQLGLSHERDEKSEHLPTCSSTGYESKNWWAA